MNAEVEKEILNDWKTGRRGLDCHQEFDSIEHFKDEVINYLDCYNNHRIKAKLKGLSPAIHRQQALKRLLN